MTSDHLVSSRPVCEFTSIDAPLPRAAIQMRIAGGTLRFLISQKSILLTNNTSFNIKWEKAVSAALKSTLLSLKPPLTG
jgi:hypothetical protein